MLIRIVTKSPSTCEVTQNAPILYLRSSIYAREKSFKSITPKLFSFFLEMQCFSVLMSLLYLNLILFSHKCTYTYLKVNIAAAIQSCRFPIICKCFINSYNASDCPTVIRLFQWQIRKFLNRQSLIPLKNTSSNGFTMTAETYSKYN